MKIDSLLIFPEELFVNCLLHKYIRFQTLKQFAIYFAIYIANIPAAN